MRILVVTPIVARSRTGNRVTALRWVRMLRGLGHRVMVVPEYASQPCDVLVVLRISGSIGLLGEEYPGYFPVGDTQALSDLLRHAENDAGFYKSLTSSCERRAALFNPANKRRAWQDLLHELGS
jgi:hypothetical protein